MGLATLVRITHGVIPIAGRKQGLRKNLPSLTLRASYGPILAIIADAGMNPGLTDAISHPNAAELILKPLSPGETRLAAGDVASNHCRKRHLGLPENALCSLQVDT